MQEALPGTTVVRVSGEQDDLRAVLTQAARRPLVVVCRDAHRHAWQQRLLATLLAARPDAVLVEMGFPGGRPSFATAYLETNGASRAGAEAAVRRLTGH
jgi:beta-N-acetylhexosaminidase